MNKYNIIFYPQQGNYREQAKYEKLAKDLAAAKGKERDVQLAKEHAEIYTEKIKKQAEDSDGEDDDLEHDVRVEERAKRGLKSFFFRNKWYRIG